LKFTDDILPVTDFRNNAADVLAQLGRTGRPIVLTQRGRASAVLLEVKAYEKLQDRLEELELRLGALEGREHGLPGPKTTLFPPDDASSLTDSLVAELEKWIED